MKRLKLTRNIYIICGVCFLLSTFLQFRIFQLSANKSVIGIILHGISCILMFTNAYINHKKIIKDN